MVESKKQLLEDLRSAYAALDLLAERIAGEDIYLEDGRYVDMEFFTEIMKFFNRQLESGTRILTALDNMLGIETPAADAKTAKKAGRNLSAAEVLRLCSFSDGVLRLPDIQLNAKAYTEVKKWITEAGGKWTGGKTQGFTFDFDATRVVSVLMEGKRCNLKQEFQFFETPAELASWLVGLAGVSEHDTVLEPSAGRGALIKAIHGMAPEVNVDYFELMPENRQFLEKMDHVTYCGEDFTKGVPGRYSRIFANPPFSRNQDIRHVRAMFDALEPSGILCAITSRHWTVSDEKICADFRKWINESKAELHDIPEAVFRESGTDVATIAIKITKQPVKPAKL